MLEDFFRLPAEVMTALATVIGYAMIPGTTALEQDSLGNFLMLIAQIIETNASQQQLLEAAADDKRMADMEQELKRLKAEVEELKKKLD